MLEASDATALLAELVNGKDSSAEVASGIGDHYSFSSSPQIVRYRAATAGGEEMEYGCSDFSRTASGPRARPHVAIVAELYLSGAGKQGGETSFPALGVKVEAKPGRIVLYESTLPDGSCDPAGSLVERTPLAKAAEDVLLMRKRCVAVPLPPWLQPWLQPWLPPLLQLVLPQPHPHHLAPHFCMPHLPSP